MRSYDIETNLRPTHTFKFVSKKIFQKTVRTFEVFFNQRAKYCKKSIKLNICFLILTRKQFLAIVKHGYLKQTTNVIANLTEKMFRTFGVDKKNETKKRVGRGKLFVPTSMQTNVRKIPKYKKIKNFESLWAEGKLKNNSHNGGTQFLNMIYYPNKSLTDDFLGKCQLASTMRPWKTTSSVLWVIITSTSHTKKECNCVDTILTPNGLHVLNKTDPNRTEGFSKSFIEYIITDLPNASFFKRYNSDTLLKTKTMTHADRRAISDFLLIGNENN